MFLNVNLSSILSMMNNTIRKDGNRAEKKRKKKSLSVSVSFKIFSEKPTAPNTHIYVQS